MENLFMNNFLYTQFLESVKNNLSKELTALHTREECEKYYNELCITFYEDSKKEKNPRFDRFDMMADAHDKLVTVLCEADEAFRERFEKEPGIFAFSKNYDGTMKVFKETIKSIPTIKENDVRFIQYLFDNYAKYKSSEDYMSRLVRRRLAVISPELLHDVNTTGVYESKEAERKETALLILRQFIKQFRDGIIEVDGQNTFIMGKNRVEYDENGDIIIGAGNYYSPSTKELCEEKYCSDFSKMAEFLSYNDMAILLESGKCKFADIARDLSDAHFGNQRKTKEFLYIFAIAFEMTFAKGDNEKPDDASDVNKCLFHDYYTDNLVNRPKTQHEEAAVDGYGINWKNFAECIFLYFIANNTKGYKADRKLYEALRLINSCKTSTLARPASKLDSAKGQFSGDAKSEEFRDNFISVLLSTDEKEFKRFLLKNYECGYDAEKGDVNWIVPTQYANERRTALDIYNGLSAAIEGKELPDQIAAYSFELSDEEGCIKYSLDTECKKRAKDTVYVTQEFVDMIRSFADRFFMEAEAEDLRKNHYKDTLIFRTDLLSRFAEKLLCDFWYQLNDKDADREEVTAVLESFPVFYDFFCKKAKAVSADSTIYEGADAILFASNYQEISSKNIFDILLIYLTYRKFYTAVNII